MISEHAYATIHEYLDVQVAENFGSVKGLHGLLLRCVEKQWIIFTIQGAEGMAWKVEEVEGFLEAATESQDVNNQVFALQFAHFESIVFICRVQSIANVAWIFRIHLYLKYIIILRF